MKVALEGVEIVELVRASEVTLLEALEKFVKAALEAIDTELGLGGREADRGEVVLPSDIVVISDATGMVRVLSVLGVIPGRDLVMNSTVSLLEGFIIGSVVSSVIDLVAVLVASCSDIAISGTTT